MLTLDYVILLIKNGVLCLMIVIRHDDMIDALEKQRRVGHVFEDILNLVDKKGEVPRPGGDKIWTLVMVFGVCSHGNWESGLLLHVKQTGVSCGVAIVGGLDASPFPFLTSLKPFPPC